MDPRVKPAVPAGRAASPLAPCGLRCARVNRFILPSARHAILEDRRILSSGRPAWVFSAGRKNLKRHRKKKLKAYARDLEQKLEARTRKLGEALEQQAATAEVLRIISSSPGKLEPVFNAMLENATRLCQANFGSLYLHEGDAFRITAMHNAPPAYEELRRNEPVMDSAHPAVQVLLGRLAKTKGIVHITDLMAVPPAARGALAKFAGARTVLGVPMVKEAELIGAIIDRKSVV